MSTVPDVSEAWRGAKDHMGTSSLLDKEEWDVPQPGEDQFNYVIQFLSQHCLKPMQYSKCSAPSMWSSFICLLSTDRKPSYATFTKCRVPSGAFTSTQGSSTTTSARMTSVIAQMLIQVWDWILTQEKMSENGSEVLLSSVPREINVKMGIFNKNFPQFVLYQ